jgi:hypothetical protein
LLCVAPADGVQALSEAVCIVQQTKIATANSFGKKAMPSFPSHFQRISFESGTMKES